MARLSICRKCKHVVNPDDEDYVVIDQEVNGDENLMHSDCYEEELEANESKTDKVG